MENIDKKFKSGLLWSFIGQFGYLLVVLLTNVLLARLLSPSEFGIIAVATFFISLSSVLTESGLSGALIRKKDATEIDNSTIFIFNLVISVFLYIVLFICSPYIEQFYKIIDLALYLRVLGLVLIINSFQIIQNVRLVKKLEYKKISSYTLVSVIFASVVSLIIAFLEYGLWALVFLQILNSLFLTLIYWIKEKGLVIYKFSKESFKELYSFGMYTTLSSLLNTGFDNIYQLVIGRYFSLNQTGFYFQAKKLSEIPVGIIRSATLGVVFSTLSNLQDNRDKFDKMYNNIIRIFTVILGLVCMGLFLYSKEILYLLYGEKWMDAEFYMKILALSSFFYMQEMFNRVLFKVFNRTRLIFLLEIFKKTVNLISLFFGIYYKSLDILMYGYLLTCIVSYFMNYYISRKVYRSSFLYKELSYTVKVVMTVAVISYIFYWFNSLYNIAFLYTLLYIPILIVMYIVILYVLNVVDLKKDLNLIKSMRK